MNTIMMLGNPADQTVIIAQAQALYLRASFREVPLSVDFPGTVTDVDVCGDLISAAVAKEESRLDRSI